MVLLASAQIDMGTPASDFSLIGIDGESYSLESLSEKSALVIIFMCVHCPYVQAIEEKIIKLQSDFEGRGVQVVGINPNDAVQYPDDSFEGMRERASMMGYNFLYLRDEDQSVAREYGVVCTPDIYVYGTQRKLRYHGRIEEVGAALDAILADDSYDEKQAPSQGCSIKWRE